MAAAKMRLPPPPPPPRPTNPANGRMPLPLPPRGDARSPPPPPPLPQAAEVGSTTGRPSRSTGTLAATVTHADTSPPPLLPPPLEAIWARDRQLTSKDTNVDDGEANIRQARASDTHRAKGLVFDTLLAARRQSHGEVMERIETPLPPSHILSHQQQTYEFSSIDVSCDILAPSNNPWKGWSVDMEELRRQLAQELLEAFDRPKASDSSFDRFNQHHKRLARGLISRAKAQTPTYKAQHKKARRQTKQKESALKPKRKSKGQSHRNLAQSVLDKIETTLSAQDVLDFPSWPSEYGISRNPCNMQSARSTGPIHDMSNEALPQTSAWEERKRLANEVLQTIDIEESVKLRSYEFLHSHAISLSSYDMPKITLMGDNDEPRTKMKVRKKKPLRTLLSKEGIEHRDLNSEELEELLADIGAPEEYCEDEYEEYYDNEYFYDDEISDSESENEEQISFDTKNYECDPEIGSEAEHFPADGKGGPQRNSKNARRLGCDDFLVLKGEKSHDYCSLANDHSSNNWGFQMIDTTMTSPSQGGYDPKVREAASGDKGDSATKPGSHRHAVFLALVESHSEFDINKQWDLTSFCCLTEEYEMENSGSPMLHHDPMHDFEYGESSAYDDIYSYDWDNNDSEREEYQRTELTENEEIDVAANFNLKQTYAVTHDEADKHNCDEVHDMPLISGLARKQQLHSRYCSESISREPIGQTSSDETDQSSSDDLDEFDVAILNSSSSFLL